ncbi:MAG: hypothetical protein ACTHM0_13555 [Sphingomonas sp.]
MRRKRPKPGPDHPWRVAANRDYARRAADRAASTTAQAAPEFTPPTAQEVFLLTYRQTGNLKQACERCGIKMFTGFFWLRKSGSPAADRKPAGTEAGRRGAAAESEFHRLVPDALPSNNVIRACNPAFDFTAYGLTIDVKYSAIGKEGTWKFQFAGRNRRKPDLYILFFATAESGDLADGYRLFLVPHELFAGRSVMTMRPGHPTHPLNHYELAPAELADALKDAGTQ